MKEKTCFKCHKVKPTSDFYKHSQMGDGYLGKCKECTKSDVKKHRRDNIEKVRAYDKTRYRENPARKDGILRYRETTRARELAYARTKARRKKWPDRERAHRAVQYDLSVGKLIKGPCTKCGSEVNVQAHHPDYSLPHHVIWLCVRCHLKTHGVDVRD